MRKVKRLIVLFVLQPGPMFGTEARLLTEDDVDGERGSAGAARVNGSVGSIIHAGCCRRVNQSENIHERPARKSQELVDPRAFERPTDGFILPGPRNPVSPPPAPHWSEQILIIINVSLSDALGKLDKAGTHHPLHSVSIATCAGISSCEESAGDLCFPGFI